MSRERERRRKGAERAQLREARRARRRSRQRVRRWIIAGVVGLVGLALIAGLVIPSFPLGRGPVGVSSPGQAVPVLPATPHLAVGQTYDRYNSNPPTSGYHSPVVVPYGLHRTPVAKEEALHNMEHGAVVIWYNTENAELVDTIEKFAQGTPGFPSCLVVTPYPDMETTIALTAWGRILSLDAFDANAMAEFVAAYSGPGGPDTPEPGVCRAES